MKMERDILQKSDGVLRESAELKYAFIHRHRQVWPISVQCRVLEPAWPGTTSTSCGEPVQRSGAT